jgi:hypothetical protein
VLKLIQFQTTALANLYNLAFGDVDNITGELNDNIVTNNGDAEKVLATVAYAVYLFSSQHPNSWIYATGSTPGRIRLYQMGISKYLMLVKADFEILGELKNEWKFYQPGINYEAFVVRKRNE